MPGGMQYVIPGAEQIVKLNVSNVSAYGTN